jgi:hypothetical protein
MLADGKGGVSVGVMRDGHAPAPMASYTVFRWSLHRVLSNPLFLFALRFFDGDVEGKGRHTHAYTHARGKVSTTKKKGGNGKSRKDTMCSNCYRVVSLFFFSLSCTAEVEKVEKRKTEKENKRTILVLGLSNLSNACTRAQTDTYTQTCRCCEKLRLGLPEEQRCLFLSFLLLFYVLFLFLRVGVSLNSLALPHSE